VVAARTLPENGGRGSAAGTALRAGRGLLLLTRPHACFTAALGVAVAALLVDRSPLDSRSLRAAVVVAVVTGAGNTLNDYFDREIYRTNRPSRPLPTGLLPPRLALAWAVLLFAGGLATSVVLGPACAALALVNSLLLVLYARTSKRWGLGKNLAVGYLVGSLFLFAALAAGELNALVVVLAACAALATTAREIVKDVEDLEGDRAEEARTLAATHGTRRARRVAFALLAASVGLAAALHPLELLGTRPLALVALGAVVFAWAYFLRSPAHAQRLIMAGSVLELMAFWLQSW
jgi:geranylgeranylglycerol-phosphate geranylgeranyltransferase